jgi:fumarate reductase subunit C
MSGPSHPKAMQPPKPGRTRTAPPQTPGSWPSHPRMRVYTLFGLTGIVYLVVGFTALRLVWALGAGPERYEAVLASFGHPLYLAFHALTLASVVFVGVRFLGLFPKAQPAQIGPLKPPPGPVIHAMLYVIWIGLTVVFGAILAGVVF